MLQRRTGQWSITSNIWPLITHIYHVMIIVTGGFPRNLFIIIIFRSSCMQTFFKTGVRNVTIFTGKHLYWSLFLIKSQALLPATLFQPCSKRNFNTNEQLFLKNTCWLLLSFWWGNCSMMDICKSSLNQNKKCWMVSTKKVGRSGQSMFLHISRNQSNMLLLINLNGIHERDLRITKTNLEHFRKY